MKKTIYNKFLAVGILFASIQGVGAQSVGSTTLYNSPVFIGSAGSLSDLSENLYIGTKAQLMDNGSWNVYSKNIVIDPAAWIAGVGTLNISNPSEKGGADSPNNIDGNASVNPIKPSIVLSNAKGMTLTDIAFPVATGFTDVAGSSVYVGTMLNQAVSGANVRLGTGTVGDLRFANTASISASSADRMVVTNNSTLSHLVRDGGGSGSFLFPVGIAEGDYTPATITGGEEYHVSVVDYAGHTDDPIVYHPEIGMARTWHIYGGAASSMQLVHNPSTNGSDYNEESSFVAQYSGYGRWLSNNGVPDFVSPGTNQSSYQGAMITTAANDGNYFSKFSDAVVLPVKWSSFSAVKAGYAALLKWTTVSEINNAGFSVERSADGKQWSKVGSVSSKASRGNSNLPLNYDYTDTSPLLGSNLYRIKQTDLDGKFDYSAVRMLTFETLGALRVYPNPATSTVSVADVPVGTQLRIMGMDGKVYRTAIVAGLPQNVNIASLAPGVYFIQTLQDGKAVGIARFIKK